MKKLTSLFIFLAVSSFCFGQFKPNSKPNSYQKNLDEAAQVLTVGNALDTTILKKSQINYNVNMGTSTTVFDKQGSVISSYVAPSISYNASSRLKIAAGIAFVMNNIRISEPVSELTQMRNQTSTSQLLFLQADYYASDRLKISGSILYNNNKLSMYSKNNPWDNNKISYSIGAQYKLTNNISIGVQMNNNYYNPNMSTFNNLNQGFYGGGF